MPRKAIDPKDGQAPGCNSDGYIGKGNAVVITYRISGLKSAKAQQEACDALWYRMRKGTNDQRDVNGPRVEGSEVVYSVHTLYMGEAQEVAFVAELQRLTEGKVEMAYQPAPPLPPAVPGVDAPSLEVVGK